MDDKINRNFKYWSDVTKETIQDAIQSGDFHLLSQQVSHSVDNMLRSFGIPTNEEERNRGRASYSSNARRASGMSSDGAANPYSKTAEDSARYAESYNRYAASQARRSSSGSHTNRPYSARPIKKAVRRESDRYYLSKNGTMKKGLIMAVAGYATTLLSFFSFTALGIIGTIDHLLLGTSSSASLGSSLITLGITAASAVVGTLGVKRLRLAARFQRYRNMLGDEPSIMISRIVEETGRSEKEVIADLEEMLKLGWFVEGHLDDEKTVLMATEEMYRLYMEKKLQSIQLRRDAETQKAKEKEKDDRIPAEVREIIHSGAEYIKEIHACNDAIPGEEITAKISRMETIIRQLFIRTEQHPEVASELRKTMSYYLPTTVKLLHAYQDLDSQPIQGDNIASSKKEIEDTLDTLNTAYEKLLDKLFKDTAWDVSTDISVIKTLLAQEGLADSDFEMPTSRPTQTARQNSYQSSGTAASNTFASGTSPASNAAAAENMNHASDTAYAQSTQYGQYNQYGSGAYAYQDAGQTASQAAAQAGQTAADEEEQ